MINFGGSTIFKDILKGKDSKLVFNSTVRPFIIFCLAVVIIVIVNSIFGKLSEDTINGYICCMILNMMITYGNLCFIKIDDETDNNTKEEG